MTTHLVVVLVGDALQKTPKAPSFQISKFKFQIGLKLSTIILQANIMLTTAGKTDMNQDRSSRMTSSRVTSCQPNHTIPTQTCTICPLKHSTQTISYQLLTVLIASFAKQLSSTRKKEMFVVCTYKTVVADVLPITRPTELKI